MDPNQEHGINVQPKEGEGSSVPPEKPSGIISLKKKRTVLKKRCTIVGKGILRDIEDRGSRTHVKRSAQKLSNLLEQAETANDDVINYFATRDDFEALEQAEVWIRDVSRDAHEALDQAREYLESRQGEAPSEFGSTSQPLGPEASQRSKAKQDEMVLDEARAVLSENLTSLDQGMAVMEEKRINRQDPNSFKEQLLQAETLLDSSLRIKTRLQEVVPQEDSEWDISLDRAQRRLTGLKQEVALSELNIEDHETSDANCEEGQLSALVAELKSSRVSESRAKLREISFQKRSPDTRRDGEAFRRDYHPNIKSKLPTFDGNVLHWPGFMDMFKALVHRTRVEPAEKLAHLKSCLGNKQQALVRHCNGDGGYVKALSILEERYGNPDQLQEMYIAELKSLSPIKPNSSESIQEFADQVLALIAGLNVEQTGGRMVIAELTDKLPLSEYAVWRQWSEALKTVSVHDFGDWISSRARHFRRISSLTQKGGSTPVMTRSWRNYSSTLSTTAERETTPCSICEKKNHQVQSCDVFKNMSLEKRREQANEKKLCFSCLRPGHRIFQCRNQTPCKKDGCKSNHNMLLHPSQKETSVATLATRSSSTSFGVVNVDVIGKHGKLVQASAVLDNCSDSTFITESFRKKCGLKKGREFPVTVNGAAGKKHELMMAPVHLNLKLPGGEESLHIVAFTMDHIMNNLKPVRWSKTKKDFEHLRDLPLEDVSGSIDILVGLDNIEALKALEVRNGKKGEPYAERTILGWIARGPITRMPKSSDVDQQVWTHFTCAQSDFELAERFFDGEAIGTEIRKGKSYSGEDLEVLKRIRTETKKHPDQPGYVVKLPWKPQAQDLKNNRNVAERRLQQLSRKFSKDPKFYEDYVRSIKQYLEKGYAHIVYSYDPFLDPRPEDPRLEEGQYFLPHQGVYKNEKKEKLRIVFDSSAELHGLSINKVLFCGPKLQVDIPEILIRFREYLVAYSADVGDMFSKIFLDEQDAKKHRFLWKTPNDSTIQVLQMDRLTFGDGPSPCVAIAALRRAAEDYGKKGGEAVETINNGFYVDDLLDSVATLREANQKAKEIDDTLKQANFVLGKWICNFEGFERQEENTDKVTTTLGMVWDTQDDSLSLKVTTALLEKPKFTMRCLLSKLASFFSPLGLHAPFVIKAKVRLSQLHLMGVGWDEDLHQKSQSVHKETCYRSRWSEEVQWWTEWCSRIQTVSKIKFPRCICPFPPKEAYLEMHCFGDASEEAFAAAIYIKTKWKDQCHITLVMAKTKVAPRKTQSVAKLELCAALLAARLANYVQSSLRLNIMSRVFWTDSTCVRHWVRATSSFYKAYVANRVGEIQTLTKPHEWRHIPGKMNIADVATRSAMEPRGDEISEQWVQGPEFLYGQDCDWPKDIDVELISEEIRPKWEFSSFPLQTQEQEEMLLDLTRAGFRRWIRILAYIAHWLRRSKKLSQRSSLDVLDYEKAEVMIVRMAQSYDFKVDIQSVVRTKEVKRGSNLLPLTPFLDGDGVLRVGGRIGKSLLPFDARHPVILTSTNPLSRRIVQHYHEKAHHAGVNYVFSKIRQSYWIIKGRELVKKVTRECTFCKKRHVQPMTQVMAELPHLRVQPAPPFCNTSVDFFGPMEIRISRNKTEKRWGVIFTCMVTRAVHLEVCPSLATPDFLNVLRTFSCLRGQPKVIYSDNGTNFVGAEKVMKPVLDKVWFGSEFQDQLVERGIRWLFQPPAAPHHGGVHEALVKSAKRAIYRVLDAAKIRRHLTETELRTLLAEVTGFLNERPLTYTSSDHKDLTPLTPNCFLIQRSNAELPPGVYEANTLKGTYEMVQKLANDVWKLWQDDYLPGLMARAKWRSIQRNLQENDVVLVVDKGLPRNKWIVGRVLKTIPDKNGMVRQARVRTAMTELVRPVVKLCLLEPYGQN